MDTRYLSLIGGLAIAGLIFFFKARGIGRAGPLPLLKNPTSGERNRVLLYFSILAALVLTLTGAIVVWGILSDPR